MSALDSMSFSAPGVVLHLNNKGREPMSIGDSLIETHLLHSCTAMHVRREGPVKHK